MATSSQVEVDGRELKLTNLDKVLYPKTGFSKGEVVDYYAKVAATIVPHLKGRALTLRRFPEGVDDTDAAFFEKRCPKHRPEWVKTTRVLAGPNAGYIDYCVCEDRATLVWMAQLAAIELHPSLSLGKKHEQPTVLAFDLDPGPPAEVLACSRVALRLREVLDQVGLESFVKTSGSKGLQLYVPLNTKTDYDETRPFAQALAQLLAKQTPDEVIAKMGKKTLRKGKVLIDWYQNNERKTTIAVYSMRARERPTVSTPLSWDEVERAVEKDDADSLVFEAADVLKRIDKHGDLFAPVLDLKQKLPEL
ncbi:MAG TPA: non-homologous end-joining DNA ligase [Solirubrobacterales bacterium]|nr:non-homologous end-joining DNA ligase [Solirubrobacterales bacterium]